MNIYFDLLTGTIVGYDNNDHPMQLDGCTSVAMDYIPDRFKFKINPASLQPVPMTGAEIVALNAPSLQDVKEAVFGELNATDSFLVSDRPLEPGEKEQWISYRKSLRDLSKIKTSPADMVRSWPKRPDGNPVIRNLRERIKQ